jgi:uncharacterized membrane protein
MYYSSIFLCLGLRKITRFLFVPSKSKSSDRKKENQKKKKKKERKKEFISWHVHYSWYSCSQLLTIYIYIYIVYYKYEGTRFILIEFSCQLIEIMSIV